MGGGSITRIAKDVGYARNITARKITGANCIVPAIRLQAERRTSRRYTAGSKNVSRLASNMAKLPFNRSWSGNR